MDPGSPCGCLAPTTLFPLFHPPRLAIFPCSPFFIPSFFNLAWLPRFAVSFLPCPPRLKRDVKRCLHSDALGATREADAALRNREHRAAMLVALGSCGPFACEIAC